MLLLLLPLNYFALAMSSTVTGAIPAPKGITPNFQHPTDVLHTINYITQALSLVIVTGFIAAKHYSKATVLRGTWHLEDCTKHSRSLGVFFLFPQKE